MWQGWKDEEQRRIRVEAECARLRNYLNDVLKQRDELTKERDELKKERDELKKERDELKKERDELKEPKTLGGGGK